MLQPKKSVKNKKENEVNNLSQEGLNLMQMSAKYGGKSVLGKIPFGIGSAIGVLQSVANSKSINLSDMIGLIPTGYGQIASLIALEAENERDTIQNFNNNKNKGKVLKPKDKEVYKTEIDNTNVVDSSIRNIYAMGGNINNMRRYAQGGDLTQFNEGGTHEQSPIGGIPIGNNNSVEQGETKRDNFVYSDRIILDNNIVSQYNLPKSLVGKSVADATKLIDNKFKGRNDKISQSTKNSMLSKIAEAQEAMKPQEPEMMQQEGIESQMAGNVPQLGQMAWGGFNENQFDPNAGVGYKFASGSENGDISSNIGGNNKGSFASNKGLQMAASIGGSIGNSMFAKNSEKLNYSPEEKGVQNAWESGKDAVGSVIPIAGLFRGAEQLGKGLGQSIGGDKGGDFANGFLDPMQNVFSKDTNFGEKALSVLDPVVSGIIMQRKNEARRTEAINKNAININKQFSDQYAMGGKIKTPLDKVSDSSGIGEDPVNDDLRFNTKQIVQYQPGVTSGHDGTDGFYIYSKKPTDSGFNYKSDREFIRNENMADLQRTPQWQNYIKNQSSQFALGGRVKPKVNIRPVETSVNSLTPTGLMQPTFDLPTASTDISTPIAQYNNPSFGKQVWDNTKVAGKFANENLGNISRYAPVATNAYQLSQLEKPKGERLDRLSNRYRPEYVDEVNLQNIAKQSMNNTVNAISQSGASQGQIRSSILGSQLQRTKALSDSYSQAAAQNRATNDRAQQFNLGIDQINLQQSNSEKDINARDQAAYRNEKSKYISAIGEGVGDIGKEQVQKKIISKTLGYKWDGTYVKDTDGNIVTDPDTGKPMTGEKLKASQSVKDKKALGGYLIKNRKY